MKERIVLFTIIVGLTVFLYLFQYHVNTMWGYVILLAIVFIYGIYHVLANKHKKRKLKKHPIKINENYKPFISILIPAHNEETVIATTVNNIMEINYTNFEIILIDDRSSDNTAEVMNNLKLKYNDKVNVLIRDKNAFPGKSAVLNDAFKIAKGDAILVFDADATVDADFLNKMVPCLEPDDVGAVQCRKVIRNCNYNLLTRCQYNEYVFDTCVQTGRDAIKGAVELRGNGELIKRKAIEDIGGWNNYTITDDLDMSTRLHIKGWDIRYCLSAEVHEEGIIYVRALFRQRRRWMEGTIRRYLEYFVESVKSAKMSLRAKLDMIIYITQFIFPLWLMLEFVIRTFKAITGKGGVHNEIVSSLIIAAVAAVGLFMSIRYSLRKYDNQNRINAFIQAVYTSFYMCILWFPVVFFICIKILFKEKDMNWGKTAHGLVLEESITHENEREELV